MRQAVVVGERGGEVRGRRRERRVGRRGAGRRLRARLVRLHPLLAVRRRLGARLPLDLPVRGRYYRGDYVAGRHVFP